MKKVLVTFIVFFGTFIYSQTTKQDKVKELISLSGNFTLTEKVLDEIFSRYKNKYSDVPDSDWKSIEEKINLNDLIDEVADIYGSNFNEKEIDQLLIFYKSEVGKKVIQNGISVGNKIQESTRNWAIKVTEIIKDDLVKMGYIESPQPTYTSPPPPMSSKK